MKVRWYYSLSLSLWSLHLYPDAKGNCLGLWWHIPFLCWHGHGGVDVLTWARHIWRTSVSPRENIPPAEKGRSEQRHLWAEHSRLEAELFSLFCYLPAVWACVSEKRECEYHFCWVILWILSQAFGTLLWDGSMFYVRCWSWTTPFIICVAFRLSALLGQ